MPTLAAGIALILYVRSGSSREAHSEREHSSTTHQQAVKTQRQIERRRGRVWWKIDELYAEFEERSATKMPVGLLPPFEVSSSANECIAEVTSGEAYTLDDVQKAYEAFRRQS
ncbi:MAG: hypothetical protein ACR2LC_06040 [Pyrinomonadaceae bacterium]